MALDYLDTTIPVQPAQKVPDEVYKLMYELGHALINDDKRDLFRTVYRHRPNYKYHGKIAKHHESPFHHWQVGTVLVLGSLFGALANAGLEAAEVARALESDGEDGSGLQ